MKNIFLVIFTLLLALVAGAQTANTRYSSNWLPLSGSQVQTLVKASAARGASSTELYQLWERASLQKQPWFYAIALRDVVKAHPQNAPALATYSLVLLDLLRDAGKTKNFARAKELYFGNDLTGGGVRSWIEQAKKLDSKQWPIWVAESQVIPFSGGPDMELSEMGRQSEASARQALALEYNSFTNSALAYALSSRASWENKPELVNHAIAAASRASQLQPVSVQANVYLLGFYQDYANRKDSFKARVVKQRIAATIPPNVKLSDEAKAYLKQLGIPEP